MAHHNIVTIMGIDFINTTEQAFVHDILKERLANQESTFVVTANPEIVMAANEDKNYGIAVRSSNYTVPDGIGVIKASEWIKKPLQERIAGYDLMLQLLNLAENNGYRCYFLGAAKEVNDKVIEHVKRDYPKLEIAGHHHGFFDIEDESIVRDVYDSDADLIFVALGLPRQELWIHKHLSKFNKGLFMGVGGSFDVISGTVKRAPDIWIKLNIEWLYRVLKQPFRLKRIFKVFKFMFLMRLGIGRYQEK